MPDSGSRPDPPLGTETPSGHTTAGSAMPRRARWWSSLCERLPLWVQLRCGIELKTFAALALVLVGAGALAVHHFWTGRPQTVRASTAEPAAVAREPATGGSAEPGPVPGSSPTGGAGRRIVVDVAGRVREPGIHSLQPGARVADALRAAGGVRRGTDTRALNRARLLGDGEQIVVGGPTAAGAAGAVATSGSGGAGGTTGAASAPSGPVSLNSATPEQLDTLPGVGPVLAQHILDYRTQHGGFSSVDQLRDVNGIGDRRFADLRPLVQP